MPVNRIERAQLVLLIIEWIISLLNVNISWHAFHLRRKKKRMIKEKVEAFHLMKKAESMLPPVPPVPTPTRGPMTFEERVKSIMGDFEGGNNEETAASIARGYGSILGPAVLPSEGMKGQRNLSNKDWWSSAFPRVLSITRGKYRDLSGGKMRFVECNNRTTGEWIWIAQCLVTSWRTIMHLSETDEEDLKYLINSLKSKENDCENTLKGKNLWDTSNVMRKECEEELDFIFEGSSWVDMDSNAKERCIYVLGDFLYRNWTTHVSVLEFFRSELKALPPVIQFNLLQVTYFTATNHVDNVSFIVIIYFQ
jgi:hypothetical protein